MHNRLITFPLLSESLTYYLLWYTLPFPSTGSDTDIAEVAAPDVAAPELFQVQVQVPLIGAEAVADIIDELQTQISGLQSSEGD